MFLCFYVYVSSWYVRMEAPSALPTCTRSLENEMVGMQPRSHVDNPESRYAEMKPLSEDVESTESLPTITHSSKNEIVVMQPPSRVDKPESRDELSLRSYSFTKAERLFVDDEPSHSTTRFNWHSWP